MSQFNLSTLSQMKGETVSLAMVDTDLPFTAEIVDVSEAPINGDRWESFSVIMTISEPETFVPEQGHYQLSHEKFGQHVLFSSPNSPTELEFVICRDRIPS